MCVTDAVSIRVVLIDRRPIVLLGFKHLIETSGLGITVAASCSKAAEALHLSLEQPVDIVLLSVYANSEFDGAVVQQLRDRLQARVIVLTDMEDSKILAAAHAGARGALEMELSPERLLQAILKVHQGELWYNRTLFARLFANNADQVERGAGDPIGSRIAQLTKREREIISITTHKVDMKLGTIAQHLNLSESTLRNHLTSIYEKLGITNRLELFAFVSKPEIKHLVN